MSDEGLITEADTYMARASLTVERWDGSEGKDVSTTTFETRWPSSEEAAGQAIGQVLRREFGERSLVMLLSAVDDLLIWFDETELSTELITDVNNLAESIRDQFERRMKDRLTKVIGQPSVV
jgi:hypothetical protein